MSKLVKFAVIEIDMHHIAKQNLSITIIGSVSFFALYFTLFGFPQSFSLSKTILFLIFFCTYYVLLIVAHELCHLIGFVLFGKVPLSTLKYGLNLKLGVAYATTTELLPNTVMRKALLLPFWLTGVLPSAIAFYIQSPSLLLAGAWLIAGAVGDFAMYYALLKYPKNCLIKDDEHYPRLHLYTTHPLEKKSA